MRHASMDKLCSGEWAKDQEKLHETDLNESFETELDKIGDEYEVSLSWYPIRDTVRILVYGENAQYSFNRIDFNSLCEFSDWLRKGLDWDIESDYFAMTNRSVIDRIFSELSNQYDCQLSIVNPTDNETHWITHNGHEEVAIECTYNSTGNVIEFSFPLYWVATPNYIKRTLEMCISKGLAIKLPSRDK